MGSSVEVQKWIMHGSLKFKVKSVLVGRRPPANVRGPPLLQGISHHCHPDCCEQHPIFRAASGQWCGWLPWCLAAPCSVAARFLLEASDARRSEFVVMADAEDPVCFKDCL